MAEQRNNALLLRSIPYSDSSLILHLLSADFGRIALMARGARRAKSPFRAGVMPLHQLAIRWREPRTGHIGTLIEVQRLCTLLPDAMILAGQELLASASTLFHEGDAHGYKELMHAFTLLAERPEASGTCAATWSMLEQSGWTGDLEHCWHCAQAVDLNQSMFWQHNHLLCTACAPNHSFQLSSGTRKSISGHMKTASIKLNQEHINMWNKMIQDIVKSHHMRT